MKIQKEIDNRAKLDGYAKDKSEFMEKKIDDTVENALLKVASILESGRAAQKYFKHKESGYAFDAVEEFDAHPNIISYLRNGLGVQITLKDEHLIKEPFNTKKFLMNTLKVWSVIIAFFFVFSIAQSFYVL